MKIGDYVRTKDGIILKIKDIEDIYTTDNIYIGMAIYDNEGHFVNEVEIIKSSPNIINLIEAGDYVNGLRVNEISEHTIYLDDMRDFSKKDINYVETIVTKEQFERMEYRIGEE